MSDAMTEFKNLARLLEARYSVKLQLAACPAWGNTETTFAVYGQEQAKAAADFRIIRGANIQEHRTTDLAGHEHRFTFVTFGAQQ